MMKNYLLFLLASSFIIVISCQQCQPTSPPPSDPNLTWDGEKTYDPSIDKIMVEQLGISDSVDIVSPTTFTVQRDLLNSDSGDVSGAYVIHERIQPMVFKAIVGNYGFDTIADVTIFEQSIAGPQLSAFALSPISFGPIGPLGCGMYKEILRIDTLNSIAETNENDNQSEHYFFVPSTQNFGLSKTELVTGVEHSIGAVVTTTFTITAGATFDVEYAHFTFVATEGSTAVTFPAPPQTITAGTTLNVNMQITVQEHTFTSGFESSIYGKVTCISEDGCIIKQEGAKVFTEHEN
jgi:hypothetical protein